MTRVRGHKVGDGRNARSRVAKRGIVSAGVGLQIWIVALDTKYTCMHFCSGKLSVTVKYELCRELNRVRRSATVRMHQVPEIPALTVQYMLIQVHVGGNCILLCLILRPLTCTLNRVCLYVDLLSHLIVPWAPPNIM